MPDFSAMMTTFALIMCAYSFEMRIDILFKSKSLNPGWESDEFERNFKNILQRNGNTLGGCMLPWHYILPNISSIILNYLKAMANRHSTSLINNITYI